MFDGLFKPKFYTKCKSLVKITKSRVDAVKRKKNSVCKYLRNDIVDLLKNNLDYNAYGRAEGLIEEKRRLSCYESLEEFCICVASNVSLLQKSSGCPDACREAISSLIYAAARVSEVPELRDLRSLFTDKYGNSLEQFVNTEFVERFKAEPPSKEMKIQLLREIAKENSIKWDANSLEQRLYTPPPPQPSHRKETEQKKTKTNEEDNTNYPKATLGNKSSLSFHSRKDSSDNKNGLSFHSRKDSLDNKNGLSFHSRKDSFDDNSKYHFSEENDSMSTSESSVTTGPEEDLEIKPFYYRFMPAPYNKPTIEKQESLPEKMTKSDFMAEETDSPTAEKPKPRSVRRRFANPPPIAEDRVETKKPEEDLYPVKQSKNTRSDSMEKTSGEGFRRMSRRTASWQPKASSIPDFDEVAARVDALSRN